MTDGDWPAGQGKARPAAKLVNNGVMSTHLPRGRLMSRRSMMSPTLPGVEALAHCGAV